MDNELKEHSNVIPFPEPSYYGDCPRCSRNDGYINLGREHWQVCHKHKVRWCIGSNLFSSWENETQQDQARNRHRIGHYQVVKPIYRLHEHYPQREMTEEELAEIPF